MKPEPQQQPVLSDDPRYFIGASPAMQEIYHTITRLIGHDLTVTITGESGSGKTLLAQSLHYLGRRKTGPFIELHVAAIAPELIEETLFGSDDGRSGRLAQAYGGTLFLSGIDALPKEVQTKFLQLLQQGEYRPIGGDKMIKADIRLICATEKNLMTMVNQGLFSEELYYRLNVIPLRIPPLRDRREDIAALAQFFLQKAARANLPPRILDIETVEAMMQYRWPGNVRELENMMLRFCTAYSDSIVGKDIFLREIRLDDAPPVLTDHGSTLEQNVRAHLQQYFDSHAGDQLPPPGLYERILPLVEKPLIEMTLRATAGNQVKAAFVLGINRNTLRKKIAELHIQPVEGK